MMVSLKTLWQCSSLKPNADSKKNTDGDCVKYYIDIIFLDSSFASSMSANESAELEQVTLMSI